MNKKKKEMIIRSCLRILTVTASVYGMSRTASGWKFLTYFTNLSNIFVDVVLMVFLLQDLSLQRKGGKRSNGWYRVKFLATISITLTFLVYMLILAPNEEAGFLQVYFRNGAGSFCVHFVTPVLAIVDYLLFDYEYESTGRDEFYGVVPPLCYVGFVYLLSAFGMRWGKGMTAPYNFLNYAATVGWFGFDLSRMSSESFGVGVVYMILVLLLLFIGLGRFFLTFQNLRRKKKLGK